jgi:hypothetical protein
LLSRRDVMRTRKCGLGDSSSDPGGESAAAAGEYTRVVYARKSSSCARRVYTRAKERSRSRQHKAVTRKHAEAAAPASRTLRAEMAGSLPLSRLGPLAMLSLAALGRLAADSASHRQSPSPLGNSATPDLLPQSTPRPTFDAHTRLIAWSYSTRELDRRTPCSESRAPAFPPTVRTCTRKIASRRAVILLRPRSGYNEPCICSCSQPTAICTQLRLEVRRGYRSRRHAHVRRLRLGEPSPSAVHDQVGRRAQRRTKVTSSARSSLSDPNASPMSAATSPTPVIGRSRHIAPPGRRRLDHVTGECGEGLIPLRSCHAGRMPKPVVCSAKRSGCGFADIATTERKSSAAGRCGHLPSAQHAHPTSCGQSGVSRACRCKLKHMRSDRIRPN